MSDDGFLFVWGAGADGQLGLDPGLLDEGRILATPTPLPIKSGVGGVAEVTQVSLGRVHSACVTRSGALYTWGMGHKGRLGHGGSDHEPQPRKVELDEAISDSVEAIQVACGLDHTVVVIDEDASAFETEDEA